MKYRSRTSLAFVLLGGLGCQHEAREPPVGMTGVVEPAPALPSGIDRPRGDTDKLQGWLYYSSVLAKMNAKDLKIESEQLRRSLDREPSWEDELRLNLVQTAQQLHSRAYQKALETFTPLLQNSRYSPELRLWLMQYHEQLQLSAQLEKELSEEKKQRGELEAKLKALSKIELEMSQREKVDTVR